MSRVIKFRGYDQENKCWRHGHYYEGVMTDAPLCLNDCRICRVIIIDGTFYHVAPESVGQFTGLTDCNGVEIYEGDTCKIQFDDGKSCAMKVIYRAPRFLLQGDGFCSLESYNVKFEVIGNIYQNPNYWDNRSSA